MLKLGKLEKIDDLRTIWPHEAQNFTKWLAQEENLGLLSETIGIELVLEERESSVGDFSADLYASEEGTGRKVIIENQLEDTNHDHLGKIITYASGKNAEVIVWIVKRARDEHRQAIEWLNQHTDEKIGFFLLEIELWRIDESSPAPKFNVVERPNDWVKEMKAAESLSEGQQLQLRYWRAFNDYAFGKSDFRKIFSQRKAQPQHWYNFSVGSSHYHIELTASLQKKRISAGIYFPDDKESYSRFLEKKELVEAHLGAPVEWIEAKKSCRFIVLRSGDMNKGQEAWEEFFEWYCSLSVKLRELIGMVNP